MGQQQPDGSAGRKSRKNILQVDGQQLSNMIVPKEQRGTNVNLIQDQRRSCFTQRHNVFGPGFMRKLFVLWQHYRVLNENLWILKSSSGEKD